MEKQGKEKRLHGNQAKIAPEKHVESLYQTNRITLTNAKRKETPIVDNDNVAYGKRFVEENKK